MTSTSGLDAVIERAESDLIALERQRILVTGGTGFVGRWLLTTLMHADMRLNLRLDVTSLSRDPSVFGSQEKAIARWCQLAAGDIRDPLVIDGVDQIIHTATPASAELNDRAPSEMRDIIVSGMSNVLAFAAACDAPVLFTSSGAVYGAQPDHIGRLPEVYRPSSEIVDGLTGYAAGKRDAEELALSSSGVVKIARLFSFVGPFLPLDTHFAIGNFIRDAVHGGPIRVAGDGSAVRSYMFATDLIVALLAVMVRGESQRPYNVGSDAPISIRNLALTVRDVVSPHTRVEVAGLAPDQLPGSAGSRYVPDTSRATTELRIECPTPLEKAIERTAAWARSVNA